jgi:hypothetical protein
MIPACVLLTSSSFFSWWIFRLANFKIMSSRVTRPSAVKHRVSFVNHQRRICVRKFVPHKVKVRCRRIDSYYWVRPLFDLLALTINHNFMISTTLP